MINDKRASDENKKILNKEQLQAIKYGKGPLLIIAGAGTGKTTAITERIKYLISSNKVKPQEILALTFTEKAAMEMVQRVDEIMPYGYTQMWISTFHSFCDRILRDEALHIGLDSHYVLMTQAETLLFLKKRLFDFKLDYFRPAGNPDKFLNGLLRHFSRLADEDVSPSEYLRWVQNQKHKLKTDKIELKKNIELANAYKKYEDLKIKEGVMDFADLISNTLKLFRLRKNVLQRYRKKFKYILVDEYQDTNISQNELVKLLAGEKVNLTVVADDDQSIYRFRGSSVSNVIQFRKSYPKAKIATLTKNYRSTQEVLNRSYDLIQHNNPDRLEVKEKIDKKLISVRKIKGKKIKFFLTDRVENEADLVVKEIKKLTSQSSIIPPAEAQHVQAGNHQLYSYGDIAILVRANNHADSFVRAFLRAGIPYQFLGPGRLLRQEGIKNLIAYLKVLYNFEDNVAFFRVLSLPIFKVSARDIAAVRNYARKINISFFEAAEQAGKLLISKKSMEKISKIVKMIHKHLKLISKESAGQILYYFLEDTGMLKQLAEFKTVKEEQQVNNIAKFFDKLKTYEIEHEDAGVETVVDWLNLKMEMGESPLASDLDWTQENKVNILTVHSAKGLEFSVVFLVNLVNERFPTRKRKEQIPIPDDLVKEVLPEGDFHEQEERRLFYVGMTRAKDCLYFTSAKFYGEAKRMKKISPFVQEALGKQFSNETMEQLSNNQQSIFDFKPAKKDYQPSAISHQPSAITYLSYSQLDTFNRCPLQYRYKYIFKIPAPVHSSASFGTSIHDALKDFYQNIKSGKKQEIEDLLIILENNWIKLGYESKKHEKFSRSLAKKILTDFYNKFHKHETVPRFLEQNFKFPIKSGLIIGGKIDRIDEKKDGRIEIIDYKTGDKLPTQKEVDKNLQLTLYAMACAQKYFLGKEPKDITLSLLFLKQGKKISTKRTKDDLRKTRKDLLEKIKEIETSDFLPTPGFMCKFCEYKLLCPVWQ